VNHPNERQVGGDHYKKAGHQQHWDSLPACGFGWEYYIGRATAYLTRVKHPLEDPGKAGHFVDKLIVLINEGKVPTEFQTTQGFRLNSDIRGRLVDVESYLQGYFKANDIWPDSPEAKAIVMLMSARTRDDLVAARTVITEIEATRQREVPGGDPAMTAPYGVLQMPSGDAAFLESLPESISQTATATTGDAVSGGGGATGSWDGEDPNAGRAAEPDSSYTNQDDAAPSSSTPD
jgi:hypothetical protein